MQMKKILFTLMILAGLSAGLRAGNPPDEGMWLPMFVERLNYVDMQKMGLKLTPQEIYDINHSSLKDAIVNLGNFCTAEVVSDKGLLFTNHHCGYDAIQTHSSIEHDYLTDGFWARSLQEELPNEGLTVSFLVKMDDVTSRVLSDVTSEMSESERSAAIGKAVEALKKEESADGKYDVSIKSFYNGNEYYRFVYEVYSDVRLVGAPPSAIGKFGGDTDNWMWPRHTGDFSIFRVYTAPDGKPATYSKENIPLKPKHSLKISLDGTERGDYAMIWGYPGSTDRYRTSHGIQATLNEINPAIIKVGGKILEIMKSDMDKSDEVRIQYASNYAGLANFWKNKIGESRGLKRLDVYDKKKEIENALSAWINADESRKEIYGTVLQDLTDVYNEQAETKFNTNLWYLSISFFGSQAMGFPMKTQGMINILKSGQKGEELQSSLAPFYEMGEEQFKDYNAATEEKIVAAILEMYRQDLPADALPDIFNLIDKKYKGDVKLFAKKMFETSVLATPEKYKAFLAKPSLKVFENDLAYKTTNSFYNSFMTQNMNAAPQQQKLKKAQRLFVDALRKSNPDKVYYPDANSTMRVTYGQVLDYYPADAVHYDLHTYMEGIIEKEDPTNDEFIVPAKLKELYEKKDYGRWADKDGRMVVCFLSNNDITGGNSGSPILNGNGDLIGLAFDGNWEAMSGDIAFEPELQRTINVDIRYVMFIIDKFANAQNLIDELKFVKNK
ncbi:MAG: S46 family peptidase [Lentimicrobiaceae bacterium]|nr:S46 family peptidase [Lentimicrobiaceae bacterium]